jgi:hypothetical protein
LLGASEPPGLRLGEDAPPEPAEHAASVAAMTSRTAVMRLDTFMVMGRSCAASGSTASRC